MATSPLVLVDGPPRCGKSTLARQLAASSSAGAILARAGSPDGRRIMANPLAFSTARPVILDGAGLDEARLLERILSARHVAGSPSGPLAGTSAAPSALLMSRSMEKVPVQPIVLPVTQPSAQPTRPPHFVLVGGPFRQEVAENGIDTAIRTRINPGGAAYPDLAYFSLGPLSLAEVGRGSVRNHWLRGGYPEAYAASSDSAAMESLENLIAGLSGGLLSSWGLPASPTRLTTLLASLVETRGGLVNENSLARMLGTSRPTVCRWMEGLELAGFLRRVPRLPGKGGARRTVQAPAWHIRDSGLVHGLVGIHSSADLRSMPRLAAASWLTYVVEQTARVIGMGTELGSYLSADGASIDLALEREDRIMAVSTRIYLPVSPGRGVSSGAEAIGATERYVVVPDGPTRNIGGGFKTIGLASFLDEASSVFS